jgi:hypothetical protein
MMIHGRSCSRSLLFAVFSFALVLSGALSVPTKAQTSSSRVKTNTMVPVYDLTKEVKVQGTIEKIDSFGRSGPIGTHILIQTASGVVDAHLGFGAAASRRYLGISVGQNVTVIGMMQAVGDTSVLMARILTTPSHIFVLRNEHGIPIRGTPRGSTRPGVSYSATFSRPGLSRSSDAVQGGF